MGAQMMGVFDGKYWQLYPHERQIISETYPRKSGVLDKIKQWSSRIYTYNVKINEIVLDEHGWPIGRRLIDFFLPGDMGNIIDTLAEMSLLGYRVYAASRDPLYGLFFVRTHDHSTDIDADLIQALVDYSKNVEIWDTIIQKER